MHKTNVQTKRRVAVESKISHLGMLLGKSQPIVPGAFLCQLKPDDSSLYLFPVANNFKVFVAPMAEITDAFPTIVPFASEGQGAVSRFGAINPVLRVSGGTSGTGLATAAGFIFTPIPQIDIRALYGSVNAPIPENEGRNRDRCRIERDNR